MVFIVPEEGQSVIPEEIWKYSEKQLPDFAIPRYIHVLDELPKTPSEKVRKIELREMGVSNDTSDRGPQPKRRKR